MPLVRHRTVCGLSFLLAACALRAGAEGASPMPAPDAANKTFEALWRPCATRCAVFEDDFLVVPGYSPQCDSSRGLTRGEVESRLTLVLDKDNGQKLAPTGEEKRAFDALPKLAPGQYGWIHSVEVVEILGPRDMRVKNIWLADPGAAKAQKEYASTKKQQLREQEEQAERVIAKEEEGDRAALAAVRAQPGKSRKENLQKAAYKPDLKKWERQRQEIRARLKDNLELVDKVAGATFKHRLEAVARQGGEAGLGATCRLSGFPTAGLKIGDRWNGPATAPGMRVAVAWADAKDNTLVLAPADLLSTAALRQELFLDLLQKRGLTASDFAARMREAEKSERRDPAEVVAQGLMRGASTPHAEAAPAQTGGQGIAPPPRGQPIQPPTRTEPAAPVAPAAPSALPVPVAPPPPSAPPALEKPIFDNL